MIETAFNCDSRLFGTRRDTRKLRQNEIEQLIRLHPGGGELKQKRKVLTRR